MNVSDSTPESAGGGGERPEIPVQLSDSGFEVQIPTGDGTYLTEIFPYPAAYPCADKGGASSARARTDAGVIETTSANRSSYP
jgi:hypothetical protein